MQLHAYGLPGCALFEVKQGGKAFGGIVLALSLFQVWAIADHFGGLSSSLGLTNPKQIEEQTVQRYESASMEVPADFAQIIERKCAEEWPSDFSMRNYCSTQQQDAISTLRRGKPNDVGADAFRIIRGKCADEWPRDFTMRAYCETQQYEGYRSLQSGGAGQTVRARCAQQWPNDYTMRVYCEGKQ